MTKREEFIEKYTDYDALGAWEIDVIPEMQRDLDDLIAAEIEAYERDQWKKYPENKPEMGRNYVFTTKEDEMIIRQWFGYGSLSKEWADDCAIAFRELPKPYEP